MTAVASKPVQFFNDGGNVPPEFQGDFTGYVDLRLTDPTPEGRTEFTLTSEQIDTDAESFFGRGFCHWLAGAVHCLTGWDLITFDRQMPDGSWQPAHTGVATPNGTVLDIFGEHPRDRVAQRYANDGTYKVRTRIVPNEAMPGDVITGIDDLRGDQFWWARTHFRGPLTAVVTHFARTLVHRHGYGWHLRRTTPSQPHNGSSSAATAPHRPHTTTATPSSGGTAVSTFAEQALTTLSLANQKAEYVRGAVAQAGLDIDEVLTMLGQVSQDAETVTNAMSIWRQAKEQLEQMHGLFDSATESADQYAAQLRN
jgi:hypothetical protein